MKSKVRKIALFGTSADPPSNSHKIILEELSKLYNIVIAYASNNPSKKHEENLYFRSLLLETLINDLNNPNIFFDQDLSSPWAINSIKKCQKKYSSGKIDFVIGSDLLDEMFLWKNIHEIVKEVKLFVIPREGYPLNADNLKLLQKYKSNYEISEFRIPQMSSSMIRENSKHFGLPQSLIPIVKNNNLYNSSV